MERPQQHETAGEIKKVRTYVRPAKLPLSRSEPLARPTHQLSIQGMVVGGARPIRISKKNHVAEAFIMCEGKAICANTRICKKSTTADCQDQNQRRLCLHATAVYPRLYEFRPLPVNEHKRKRRFVPLSSAYLSHREVIRLPHSERPPAGSDIVCQRSCSA